jgi:hypothetical protein
LAEVDGMELRVEEFAIPWCLRFVDCIVSYTVAVL